MPPWRIKPRGEDLPVKLNGGLHSQHNERCHSVAHGQLSDCPGNNVIGYLQRHWREEVMSAVVSYLQVREKLTENYTNSFLRQSHMDTLQCMTLHLPSALLPQEGLYTSYKALTAGTQKCMDWHIQDLTVNQQQTEKWPPVYSVISTGADCLILGVWHNIFWEESCYDVIFLPPGFHCSLVINSKTKLL